MSQVNGNVYPNTTFPDSIQTLPTFTDLSSTDQTNYINYLKAVIEGNISQANTYLNQITNTAIVDANKLNILADTINAIQQVYSSTTIFADIINEKQTEWRNIINKFSYIGDWVEPIEYTSRTYNKGDVVLYNTKCWICKVNGTVSTNPPAEGTYWTQYYKKYSIVTYENTADNRVMLYVALDDINSNASPSEGGRWGCLTLLGDIGQNGNGFLFDNEWDSTKSYSMGNLVIYEGNAYSSLTYNNLNHNPTENPTYWQKEFSTSMQQIPVQYEQPTNQSIGDIWFKVLNISYN